MSDETSYWVITASEDAYGPYESAELAYEFAITNLGFDGWTITTTS